MVYTNTREVVLSQTDIRAVVNYYCPNLVFNRFNRIPCPIHGGENANFKLYPETNSYYCFTCHSAGDPIRFVSELFGISYQSAMYKLCEDMGIKSIDKMTFSEYRRFKSRQEERRQLLGQIEYAKHRAKRRQQIIKDQYDCMFRDYLRLVSYRERCPPDSDIFAFAVSEIPRLEFELDLLQNKIQLIGEQCELRCTYLHQVFAASMSGKDKKDKTYERYERHKKHKPAWRKPCRQHTQSECK